MKSKISSVIQEFLDIKRLLYLSIYYLSVLPVMSTVLYSGKNRTVGILGGRWYGALFVYFPAATAFFAVILYCAIQAISHQRKIK
jgi:hypothetical protein